MQVKTGFALIMLFWSSLYLLHISLRSSSRYAFRYLSWLDRLGLSFHVAQVRWFTTGYNRCFIRLAQWRSRLWNLWFGLGAIVGVLLCGASIFILSFVLYDGVSKQLLDFTSPRETLKDGDDLVSSSSSSSISSSVPPRQSSPQANNNKNQLMTPILPGVNLPSNQIGYYLFTLFLCGVLHEIGHAVAANCSNIRVNGFGFFVALIYPGAYVDLNSESLQAARPWQQLKVYCAGVWHNVVIVVAAVAYLYHSRVLFSPLYSTGSGAVVSSVLPDSVISGKRGLQIGDVVVKVANCPVQSADDWRGCLMNQTIHPDATGYCVPIGYILQHHHNAHRKEKLASESESAANDNGTKAVNPDDDDVSLQETCCDANHTAKDLCFSYRTKDAQAGQYACLPARSVSERPTCHVNADCVGGRRVKTDLAKSVCLFPSVGNRTRLVRISRPPSSVILFLGNPLELRFSVRVIDFRKRFRFLPVNAPAVIELCCKYLASLSGALALLNVVPCYALDGQHILASILDICLPTSLFSRVTKGRVNLLFLLLGSSLLFMNIALAFYNLL